MDVVEAPEGRAVHVVHEGRIVVEAPDGRVVHVVHVVHEGRMVANGGHAVEVRAVEVQRQEVANRGMIGNRRADGIRLQATLAQDQITRVLATLGGRTILGVQHPGRARHDGAPGAKKVVMIMDTLNNMNGRAGTNATTLHQLRLPQHPLP